MIDAILTQAKIVLLGWLWGNYWSFYETWWGFTKAHWIMSPLMSFAAFALGFAAYSTFRRMWDDGTFKALSTSHQVTLVSVCIIPFLHFYLFDIFVLRVVLVWIFAGVPPYYQDWKFLSASWTFSRWVWLFKDRTPGAHWWHVLLHAVEPRGH